MKRFVADCKLPATGNRLTIAIANKHAAPEYPGVTIASRNQHPLELVRCRVTNPHVRIECLDRRCTRCRQFIEERLCCRARERNWRAVVCTEVLALARVREGNDPHRLLLNLFNVPHRSSPSLVEQLLFTSVGMLFTLTANGIVLRTWVAPER